MEPNLAILYILAIKHRVIALWYAHKSYAESAIKIHAQEHVREYVGRGTVIHNEAKQILIGSMGCNLSTWTGLLMNVW